MVWRSRVDRWLSRSPYFRKLVAVALCGILALGPWRAPGGGDGAFGGRDVLVGEGELGEGGAQVPGEVAGEHADQDVAAASWPAGQLASWRHCSPVAGRGSERLCGG